MFQPTNSSYLLPPGNDHQYILDSYESDFKNNSEVTTKV